MNDKLKIVLSTLGWCAILGYLFFAVQKCGAGRDNTPVTLVEVSILDEERHKLVDAGTVKQWIRDKGWLADSIPASELNTSMIKEHLESHAFVKSARVYTDMTGRLNIDIRQRRPIARFKTSNGYDFYLSDDNWVMPVQPGSATYVPVVTGNPPLPFARDYFGAIEKAVPDAQKKSDQSYLYLHKLINFVRLTGSSTFWDSQIVQINVAATEGQSGGAGADGQSLVRWKEPQVELVPRVGRHLVLLGTLDDAEVKLEKLMLFYRKVLDYEGWNAYSVINLKYRDQIVCTK